MTDRAQILITAVDQTRQAFSTVNASLEKLSGLAGKMNTALGCARRGPVPDGPGGRRQLCQDDPNDRGLG